MAVVWASLTGRGATCHRPRMLPKWRLGGRMQEFHVWEVYLALSLQAICQEAKGAGEVAKFQVAGPLTTILLLESLLSGKAYPSGAVLTRKVDVAAPLEAALGEVVDLCCDGVLVVGLAEQSLVGSSGATSVGETCSHHRARAPNLCLGW